MTDAQDGHRDNMWKRRMVKLTFGSEKSILFPEILNIKIHVSKDVSMCIRL